MTLQWTGGDKRSRWIAALLIMGATPWLAQASGAETASPGSASVLLSVERVEFQKAVGDTAQSRAILAQIEEFKSLK
ncbi:MAG: hypothetical protein WD845_03205 [Pirellulales bacterium]